MLLIWSRSACSLIEHEICHRSCSFINVIISSCHPNFRTFSKQHREKCPSTFLRGRCVCGLGSHSGIVAIPLSHRESKTLKPCICVRALPTNKPILNQREATVQRDTPSPTPRNLGRKLSRLLLRPSNFSARSSSSLYFWSSRYSCERRQKKEIKTGLADSHQRGK